MDEPLDDVYDGIHDEAILKGASESFRSFFSCGQAPCPTSSCSMELLAVDLPAVDLQSVVQEALGGALDEIRTAVSSSSPSTKHNDTPPTSNEHDWEKWRKKNNEPQLTARVLQ
jgi:hypothetical protein